MSTQTPRSAAGPRKDPVQVPVCDFTWPDVCTQMQVRYTCGHTIGGEFLKCQKHFVREDERCASCDIQYVEAKLSSHKCRTCLHTPDGL
ncbi:hypothetical protein PENSTE_c008G10317 [Penicillium steckii]|uniref:Uncharacterized protein n=1 Tax=Penicillium steckii TaxID=303698 RepID=A0A1V6TB67_9EURO|nr:hypothetical protein PENSTE_c008G10317 [Penicillium steckii]